ncbi:MAG TPA: hypothetical protein VHR88_02390 [Solirubrobacteraceae bacterium]|nr:hypothetical protein [Solirubrobacteraceae bacterium]
MSLARLRGALGALRSPHVLGALSALPAALALAAPAAADPTPVTPSGPVPTLAAHMGKAAHAQPVRGIRPAPQQPFMAPDPKNNVHNDSWMTDDYPGLSGPLGRSPDQFSTTIGRDCVTLTFDAKGRLVGTCTDLSHGPALYMFDPRTLDTLAFLQLPYVPPPAGTNPATNTTGGAYFYLDNQDRAVVATSDRRISVYAETDTGGQPGFAQVASYDPTPCLPPDERMPSVLPDSRGRLWFVGRTHGTVGVLDRSSGRCGSIVLGEEIENSFASARDGIYIVSDTAQYKFRAGAALQPRAIWRATYRNTGRQKVGQFNAGSGTTPTLLWSSKADERSKVPDYVAITDNADPLDVIVYRTADRLEHGQRRVVCQIPVFGKGASADENSLIAVGQSLIAENNSGYDLTTWNDQLGDGTQIGGDLNLVSRPGMARIDIAADGRSCKQAWTNTAVRPPSAVSKGDSANGLIYTYENLRDSSGADPWYWSALSYRTGKVVWRVRAGYGGLFNNHYAGIALGKAPGGPATLYLGGIGGIMALRDG